MGAAWLLRLTLPTPCRRRCLMGMSSRLNDRYVSALSSRARLSLARFMCVCLFSSSLLSFRGGSQVLPPSPSLSELRPPYFFPDNLQAVAGNSFCTSRPPFLPSSPSFHRLLRFLIRPFLLSLLSTLFSSSFSVPRFLIPFVPPSNLMHTAPVYKFSPYPPLPPFPPPFPRPPPAGPARWPQQRGAPEQTCPHARDPRCNRCLPPLPCWTARPS